MYHGRGTYAPFCRSACTICAVDVHHSGRRIQELLAEKNPLYGRAIGIYKMKGMGFYDAAKFFPDCRGVISPLALAGG